MPRYVDLHVHSTASDGVDSPTDIAHKAAERGLAVCALTDHDTLDGVSEFLDAADKVGVIGVPGVEIGIEDDDERGFREVHVLGYFVRPGGHALGRTCASLTAAKLSWAEHQVLRLRDAGYAVPFDEVKHRAGTSPTIRRPHIWHVVEKYHGDRITASEFYRGTDYGGSLHVAKSFYVTLEEAVECIRESGGVAVLAHPALYGVWPQGALSVVEQAVAAGVRGVEAVYDYDSIVDRGLPPSREITRVLTDQARKLGAVITGGSDYHGFVKSGVSLGQAQVPYACYEELLSCRP